jgi:diaminopimelate decarboxylase
VDHFQYKDGRVFCEDVPLELISQVVGTPAYVYSKSTLRRHCDKLVEAFAGYPTTPCFAVKANSNLSFLKEIFAAGLGADLVSLGELKRALYAGVDPQKIVFSGVGKKPEEIQAGLEAKILSFNVESDYELRLIESIACQSGKIAPVCLRINPNVNAKTHPKIATGMFDNKFGLTEDVATGLLDFIKTSKHLELVGLACHIGSQITDLGPLKEASERMTELCLRVTQEGHPLKFLDMGGGLGIRYENETPPPLTDYANTIIDSVKRTGLRLVIEPGRVIAGNTGILLTKVLGVKKTPKKHFVIVDAAMNDLSRPSVYDAFHEILPVVEEDGETIKCDVVGPICESGDFLGKDRNLTRPKEGDLLIVRSCGAYASSMASNYNSRSRAPEVMVSGNRYQIVRQREELEDLWRTELDALNNPEMNHV